MRAINSKGNATAGFQSAITKSPINNCLNKSPSNSNKTRTADTSTYTGSRAISWSSLGNTVPDQG